MLARSVRYWPGWKSKLSRSDSGTVRAIATEPAASGLICATRRVWKRGEVDMVRQIGRKSIRFEIVKRFQAVQAAVKRLAGRGAKVRGFCGVGRAALRAGHRDLFASSRLSWRKLNDDV